MLRGDEIEIAVANMSNDYLVVKLRVSGAEDIVSGFGQLHGPTPSKSTHPVPGLIMCSTSVLGSQSS